MEAESSILLENDAPIVDTPPFVPPPLPSTPAWSWEFDTLTAVNLSFDTFAFVFLVALFVHRLRVNLTKSTKTAAAHKPASYSVWGPKPVAIVLFTTILVAIYHALRISVIAILWFDDRKRRLEEESEASMDDMDKEDTIPPSEEQEWRAINPLVKVPGVIVVLGLALFGLFAKISIMTLFATRNVTSVTSQQESSSVSKTQPEKRSRSLSTNSITSASGPNPISPVVLAPKRESAQSLAHNLVSRLYGPRQNIYIVALLGILGGAAAYLPFAQSTAWILSAPWLDFICTIWLASVWQEARSVPGLTVKDKRQRGIPTFKRVVQTRVLALVFIAAAYYEVLADAFWRIGMDSSLLFLLWSVEA